MQCELCGSKQYLQKHHLFGQGTKRGWRRKLYGELLDDEKNIMVLCAHCHLWKTIPTISEEEFCKRLNINIRSKTGKLKKL